MFHHVKELQFNARVSGPDPRFANMLLEQFGGANGELKAAIQYFTQAFGVRKAHPDKYDLLMDIATEEFSHLEIVGATITMLLEGVNGELKDASHESGWMAMLDGKAEKENIIHQAMCNPQFLNLTGGGPAVRDSNGYPWNGTYVDSNGDLTVDLRSNIGAESRAKIVYEYLIQFTDDPFVKDTLTFLMTREVSHFQMFSAALETIQPNFPPGVLQGDPRYTRTAFNLSNGESARGPWNEGQGPWKEGEWVYVEKPLQHVVETDGLLEETVEGTAQTVEEAKLMGAELGKVRSKEIKQAVGTGASQWSDYPQKNIAGPSTVDTAKKQSS
jgi:Mn-containing catalase